MLSGYAGLHAALDGIERAFLRLLGFEAAVGGFGEAGEVDVLFMEPLVEILEGEHDVEQFGMVLGLALLGDAGTDEDDADVFTEVSAQHFAVREQGREDGRNVGLAVGAVLGDIVDNHGTGRGDPDALRLAAHERGDASRDLLRAQGRLRDGVEAEALECVNQLRGADAGELRDERGREGDDHGAAALEQLLGGGQIVAYLLGAVGAGEHAVAADDAELGDDARAGVLHADGFDRTLANAFVAILALALPRVDGIKPLHSVDPVPSIRSSNPSTVFAEWRATVRQ